MNEWKIWTAFVIGVAAGAGVALLYAPQSGEKTRRQVRRKLEDATDYVKDAADNLSEHAGKVYKAGREAVGDAVDSAGSAYNVAAKRVQEII
jgi:gas vesicle protein